MDSIEYLDPESIHGLNLYAYCGNNPVMCVDPSGCVALTILGVSIYTILKAMAIGFAVGGAISGAYEIGKQIHSNGWNPGGWNWEQIGLSALGGAVAGAISSIPIGGWFGAMFFGAAGSFAGGLISGSVRLDDPWSIVKAVGVGALANLFAFKINSKIINFRTKKIFNLNNKAKSLAVQKLQVKTNSMGREVLKGSWRNAFKKTSFEAILDLIEKLPTFKYGLYSTLMSSFFSGWN